MFASGGCKGCDAYKGQPGHEYTKQNVKFLTTVLQTKPVKELQSFAENNEQTQGKFTIGDEKVGSKTGAS